MKVSLCRYYIFEYVPTSWNNINNFSWISYLRTSASQLNPHPRLQLWRGQTFSQQTGGTIHSEQMYSYMKIIFEHMLTSWMKTWQMNLLPPENYIWACATQLEENLVDGFTTAWMACGHIYQSAELSWNISAVTKLASCLSHVNQRVLPMKLQNVTASFHTFGGVYAWNWLFGMALWTLLFYF